MPIYEYRCENGHTFEVFQSMSADPVTACEECDAPVERVFHPVAIHFKGSGFYNTDYKKDGAAASKDGDSGSSGDKSESKSKSDSGSGEKNSDSSKSESASKAKSSSSSD